MAKRIGTIEDIAARGWRLRLWCFGCARASERDAGEMLALFTRRAWPIDLTAARSRFVCRTCGSARNVLIVPASPLPPPPMVQPEPERTWAAEVEAFFHGMRAQRKMRADPLHEEIAARLLRELADRQRPR